MKFTCNEKQILLLFTSAFKKSRKADEYFIRRKLQKTGLLGPGKFHFP